MPAKGLPRLTLLRFVSRCTPNKDSFGEVASLQHTIHLHLLEIFPRILQPLVIVVVVGIVVNFLSASDDNKMQETLNK